MNRLNINFKNRKVLYVILTIALICVFTLTIAYAALNAVLTISGNAQVVSSSWDIKLANPIVISGSVNNNLPTINGNTLSFSATLKAPGDFYEFTVDVVNNGNIDAMIDDILKTPELTEEQSRYLKYEISYKNGEPVSSKQTLFKNSTMPVKVRVEYRRDITNSDLNVEKPTLNLSLSFIYVQSDGTGSTVTDNGDVYSPVRIVSGDINTVGSEVCIGDECFHVVENSVEGVKLLTKYNLYVGKVFTDSNTGTLMEDATGIQSPLARGVTFSKSDYQAINPPWYGIVKFSETMYWGTSSTAYQYIYNENSNAYQYVESYEAYLEGLGVDVLDARLLSMEEYDYITDNSESGENCAFGEPDWLCYTSFHFGSATSTGSSIWIWSGLGFLNAPAFELEYAGVRPVIVISSKYF